MWLSVKAHWIIQLIQCQPLDEEGPLCRGAPGSERVGPLEAGILARPLGVAELCALGSSCPHLTPNPGAQSFPPTSAGLSGGAGTTEGGALAQRQGEVGRERCAPNADPPALQPALPLVSWVTLQRH